MVANNVLNQIIQQDVKRKMPLKRKSGHMYLKWKPNEILFRSQEFIKPHRIFSSPDSKKTIELNQESTATSR